MAYILFDPIESEYATRNSLLSPLAEISGKRTVSLPILNKWQITGHTSFNLRSKLISITGAISMVPGNLLSSANCSGPPKK